MNQNFKIQVGLFTVLIGEHPDKHAPHPYIWSGCECQKCIEWRNFPITADEKYTYRHMHAPFVFERIWSDLMRRNKLRRQAIAKVFA